MLFAFASFDCKLVLMLEILMLQVRVEYGSCSSVGEGVPTTVLLESVGGVCGTQSTVVARHTGHI